MTRDLVAREDLIAGTAELRLPDGLWGLYRDYLSREIARDRLGQEWRHLVRPVLSLLACSRGDGLTIRQIVRAVPELAGQELAAAQVADALRACGQFLVWPGQDASARIWHSSFRDFLMQDEHFGIFPEQANRVLARSLIERWEGQWDDCDESYALAHLPGHLLEDVRDTGDDVLTESLLRLLTDLSFGRKKTASLGVDSFVADLRETAALLPGSAEGRLRELLETIDRISHELRLWDAAEAPARFEQQLMLRAEDSGLAWLSRECADRLEARGMLYVKTHWRASLESRALQRVMTGHRAHVEGVVLTEDQTHAVSASSDGTGRVWDLDTGQVVCIFDCGDAALCCLSRCAADTVVVGDRSGGVWLWDLGTLDVRRIASIQARVRSVHLTADGAVALAVDEVGTIAVIPAAGGAARTFRCSGPLGYATDGNVAWLADDKRVLIGLKSGRIEVWDYAEGRQEAELGGHPDEVMFIAVSDDCGLAASASNPEPVSALMNPGSGDGIRIWNLDSYQQVRSLGYSAGQCYGMAFRRGTSFLVAALSTYGLVVWDLRTGEPEQLQPLPRTIMYHLALSPDGRYALTSSATGEFGIRVWDLDARRLASPLHGHSLTVTAMCVTGDGRRVVTGSADQTIRVWNMDRLEAHGARVGHSGSVTAIGVFPERDLVCSGSLDDTLRVWSLSTGLHLCDYWRQHLAIAVIAPMSSSHFLIGALDRIEAWPFHFRERFAPTAGIEEIFSTSGVVCVPALRRVVATSYHASEVFIWQISTSEWRPALEGHEDDINGLAATSDGRLFITASSDKTLRVWETATERCLHVLNGHDCAVRGVAVSPDDRLMVSSGDDGSLIVWDVEQGVQVGRVDGDGAVIYSVSITPDGAHIVSGDEHGRLRLWTLGTTPKLRITALLDGQINCVQALQGKVVAGSTSGSLYVLDYR